MSLKPIPNRFDFRVRLRRPGGEPHPDPANRLTALYKQEVQASPNPVLRSIFPILEHPLYVQTDVNRVLEVAEAYKDKPLNPSTWKLPNFIEEDSENTVQFFMISAAVNFKFWNRNAADKFAVVYRGETYEGSMGMVACLKRAYEEGIPILDADYLSRLTVPEARRIFRGNMEIPMIEERVIHLNNVGKVLKEKYGGSFYSLYKASGGYAFRNGRGMVERLMRDFEAFRDEWRDPLSGKQVRFDKRAQLAVAEIYSRLRGTGLFEVKDINRLTVFADYQLPKTLHHLGILKYSPGLEQKIQRGEIIPKGSREEIEIRAHTLYAAKLLELALKEQGRNVNALHVDYLLWSEGRKLKGEPHHLTPTTAY